MSLRAAARLILRGATAAVLCGALGFAAVALPLAPVALAAAAEGGEAWFQEFEDVCSRTQDAMTIADDELRTLVKRCDALKPRIEALDPTRRKVYGRRLQLCRDLYQFVLDARAGAK